MTNVNARSMGYATANAVNPVGNNPVRNFITGAYIYFTNEELKAIRTSDLRAGDEAFISAKRSQLLQQ